MKNFNIKSIIQNSAIKMSEFQIRQNLKDSLNMNIKNDLDYPLADNKKSYMLYAHVPFCHTFCPYCSFHKYKYDKDLAKKYFVELREQIKQVADLGYDFDSMYVGGGTTLIDEAELEKTLRLSKDLFNIKEISCESDPNHIDPEKLKDFKGLIDRLSVGIQSFDDDILRKVSRYDKFGSGKIVLEKVQKAVGILPIFSLDLIFNFPFQTKEMLARDIEFAKMANPEQITFYPLMKSGITRDKIAASLGSSPQNNEREFYQFINEKMSDWHKNNVWAYSKKASELKDEYVSSKHEYLGVGSGAFSFLDDKLYVNAFDLQEYSEKISAKKAAFIADCSFDKSSFAKYLFLTEIFDGEINFADFKRRNGIDLKIALKNELMGLKLAKATYEENGVLKLSDFGRYLILVMMKEFYIGMDMVRAVFRAQQDKCTKRLRVMKNAKKSAFL